MNYIILEMQTTNGTTSVLDPVVKADRNAAEATYHNKLAYAALSNVHIHSVSMLTENGKVIRSEAYDHTPAPEPVEEE